MEDMTEEELEAYKEQVTTTLSARRSDDVQDLDSILSEKGELKSLAEETGELVLPTPQLSEQLFEITGEDGVLPGEKVNIGMSLTDSSFAGNEVSEATANFSFDEKEEKPLATVKAKAEGDAPAKARKAVRRRPSRQPKEGRGTGRNRCLRCLRRRRARRGNRMRCLRRKIQLSVCQRS